MTDIFETRSAADDLAWLDAEKNIPLDELPEHIERLGMTAGYWIEYARRIEAELSIYRAAIPVVISCNNPDCRSPWEDEDFDTLPDAIKAGWTVLEVNSGPNWNFVGTCPACNREPAPGVDDPNSHECPLHPEAAK